MALLLLMVLIMPYEQNPYLYISPSFLGVFPDFTVIKLLGLLGCAWALVRMAAGDVPWGLGSRQTKLFLLFYTGVTLSGIWSGSGYIAVTRYLAFLLFLPLIVVAVRDQRDVTRVARYMVIAWVLAFPYGLRQMYRFNGRFGVGIHESNYLATNLCLVIPLAFALAVQHRERLQRALWLGAAGVLVFMVMLTGSRGGFLGLVVAGTIFVYRRRGALAAIGLVLVLVVAALPTSLGQRALATLSSDTPAPSGLEASNEAHIALFWAALRMIADAPITGVGPYNFKEMSTRYTGLDVGLIAHNSYLELAAEVGLPVLALFLLVVTATFRGLAMGVRLRRPAGAPRDLAGLAEALRSGLAGFLVAGAFISAQYEKWFWLVVFLSIAIERLARASAAAALAGETPSGAPVAEWRPTPQAS
jgi:hypothetical protein